MCLVSALARADAQPAFDTLTRADGLPSDYVQAVYQDRFGFLWFGTDAGLARYDGRRVVTFTADDGLPDPFVYAVGEDHAGVLWVGTFSGLARKEGERFVEVTTPFGDEPIVAVEPGPGGRMLVQTGTQVGVQEEGGWRVLDAGAANGWSGVVALDDGSVVVSRRLGETDDGPWDLARFSPRGRAPTPVATEQTAAGGRWISGTEDGRILLASREQVSLGRLLEGRFVAEAAYPIADARRMTLGARGELYVIADEGGIWSADAPDAPPVLLSTRRAQDLVVDREGGVWVGTFGEGVLRLAGRHLGIVTRTPALRLAVDGPTVWATSGAAVVQIDSETMKPRSRMVRPGLREVVVAQEGLYLTSGPNGMWLEDPLSPALPVPRFMDPNWISGMEAATDTVWVSGYGSGIVRYHDGAVLDTLRAADGLGTDMVEGLTRTSHGVWALTRSNGAALVQGDRITRVTRTDGLPSSAIYAVGEQADGTVWFGTDRGLGRWDGETATAVGARELGRQRMLAVFERPGGMFAVGERGLYQVEGDRVRALGPVLFGAASRASINAVAYVPETDRVVLATTAGILSLDFRKIPNVITAPQVAVLSLRVDDDEQVITGSVLDGRAATIPPGRHRVEVEFASLFYGAGAGVEYRVGAGPWQPTGPEQRVVFSDLGAGEHVIEARAVGPDGAHSEEVARMTLQVAPRWWERPAVVWALGLLGLGVFALAIRELSQRRLRREVERLEVGRRVQSERERISRDLHDHVGAQLSSLLAGVELAKLARRARGEADPVGGDGAMADPLEAVETDARETIRQLRETIWALHDEALTAGAFCQRLDAYVRSHAKDRIADVQVTCDGAPEQVLPPAIALSLYRIAQEAVTNALKHSGARSLVITLRPAVESVSLAIADDGRFVPPVGGDGLSGFGIGSMRTRAEQLGGTFDLDTASGTRVSVDVPVTTPPA